MKHQLVFAVVLAAVLGGCVSVRQQAAESATLATEVAQQAAPVLADTCLRPYATAAAAGDKPAMAKLDAQCEAPVAAYDVLRDAVLTTKAALVAGDTAALAPAVLQLAKATQTLVQALRGLR